MGCWEEIQSHRGVSRYFMGKSIVRFEKHIIMVHSVLHLGIWRSSLPTVWCLDGLCEWLLNTRSALTLLLWLGFWIIPLARQLYECSPRMLWLLIFPPGFCIYRGPRKILECFCLLGCQLQRYISQNGLIISNRIRLTSQTTDADDAISFDAAEDQY